MALDNQIVERAGFHLRCKGGIATGFAPGVDFANLYLDEMDQDMYGLDSTKAYRRFVGDAFIATTAGDSAARMSGYDSHIQWAATEVRMAVHYLDRHLELRAGRY